MKDWIPTMIERRSLRCGFLLLMLVAPLSGCVDAAGCDPPTWRATGSAQGNQYSADGDAYFWIDEALDLFYLETHYRGWSGGDEETKDVSKALLRCMKAWAGGSHEALQEDPELAFRSKVLASELEAYRPLIEQDTGPAATSQSNLCVEARTYVLKLWTTDGPRSFAATSCEWDHRPGMRPLMGAARDLIENASRRAHTRTLPEFR